MALLVGRCAGEVAAVAFNEYCGVGVAYNASIGGGFPRHSALARCAVRDTC